MAEIAVAQTRKGHRRAVVIGIFSIIIAVFVLILGANPAGPTSTFVLTSQRAGVTIPAPDLVLPTTATLYILGAVAGLLGLWQLLRGFKRETMIIVLGAAIAVTAFLIWATAGRSLNLTGMLVSSLVRATP